MFIFWGLLSVAYFWSALTSHISTSEFWPLTISKELWNFDTPEYSVYFKPSFYLIYSFLHMIPLSNETHVLFGRVLMGIVSIGSFYCLFRIFELVFGSTQKRNIFFIVGLLAFSPLMFSHLIKIRSDHYSLFFTLLLIFASLKFPPPWPGKHLLLFVGLHYLVLSATPRAIFHDLVGLTFIIPFYWNRLKINADTRRQFLLVFGGPLLSMAVIFFPIGSALGTQIFIYIRNTYATGSGYWFHFWGWLQREPLLASMIVAGAIQFLRHAKNQWYLFFPAVVAFLSFAAADLKTPYLLASLLPFFLFPLAGALAMRPLSTRKLLAFFFLLLGSHALFTARLDWWSSNRHQIEIIRKVSAFLGEHPMYTYFDGLGLLPRSNQLIAYLGPDDDVALEGARRKVLSQKPSVILYNQRMIFLGESYKDYLFKNYRQIAPNLYLRNDLEDDLREDMRFTEIPILLFNLTPIEY